MTVEKVAERLRQSLQVSLPAIASVLRLVPWHLNTARRNALGARGIDRIETLTSSGSSVAYPVYDGHGNMVATRAKSGSGYQIGNRRSFGAWGDVRQGNQTGSPNGKYCANLGHVSDDESELTYMRARYYEASSGRFLSEDSELAGTNWYMYCRNDPVSGFDPDGCNAWFDFNMGMGMLMLANAFMLSFSRWGSITPSKLERAVVVGSLALAAFHFAEAIGETEFGPNRQLKFLGMAIAYAGVFATIAEALDKAKYTSGFAMAAVIGATTYSLLCLGIIIGTQADGE